MPKVILKQNRLGPILGYHPWIDQRAIESVEGEPSEGSFVTIEDEKGKVLAQGAYQPKSSIRVRVWAWGQEELNENLVRKKIEAAVHLRHNLLKLDQRHTGYRVFFSEADGISGLIVDRFGDVLVVQSGSPAIASHWSWFEKTLKDLFPGFSILQAGFEPRENESRDDSSSSESKIELPKEVKEYDLKFLTYPGMGQKTGFFFDQRENRNLVSDYAQGRKVLDLFSYSGGFSIACLKKGALSALAVDSSAPAIDMAKQNAELNQVADRFQSVHSDVRKALSELQEKDQKFSLVVLDPPKLIKNAFTKQNGMRAYFKLNERALSRIEAGGILVTCSCSGNLSSEEFQFLVSSVFRRAKRRGKILHSLGAGPDHPVLLSCPETQYLKCLIVQVDS